MSLQDQAGIVTGAAQGLGRAMALRLARDGARVGICDLDLAKAEVVAQEIAADNGVAVALQADVSRAEDVRRMVAKAEAALGTISFAVNNAGTWHRAFVEDMSEAAWRKVIDVNLTGTFLVSQAVTPILKRRGGGRIVNIASTAALRIGHASGAAYTASKAGVLGLTRHLAYELAPYGITVNAVCPGTTPTAAIAGESVEEIRERLKSFPSGHFPRPEDHAELVAFLISDAAASMTGQALVVDAGASLGWTDFESYKKIMRKEAMG
jgi:NAD(P)-dependent dehydrogenase (short-subunit alcohol dehydrogenase family)